MSNSSVSEQPNGPKCIQIPRGWSRILEKGSILYISPNNSRLRSLDHVIEYLKTEGTCKCGLDCPLYIHKVFNFDARIPSKLVPVGSRPEGPQSSCKHCATDLFEVPTVPTEVTVQQPKKDAKLPSFSTLAKDALGQKRGPGRPRNSSSKSRRGNVPKPALNRPTSPLHNIPLPVPSSITNSPVQSVPTNITAVNQGPLPSFATIVSSSKLFNPGAGLGSAMLASSTVTSTVSSCPLTTVALLSSKSNSTTQNVCVSSSASILHTAPSLVHSTEASKVAPTVTSSVTVSHQQPVTVSAQLPSKTKEATLPKCSTAADSNPASLSATSSSLCSSDVSTVSKAISSAVTTVVSARAKTDPVSNQNLKSLSAENNSLEVKSVAKAGVPRASKPAKPYGGRKTVAASLKATSVSKVSAASVTTRPIITDTSLPKMHTVATTATAPSCQVATGNRSSQLPSQVLPTVPVSTTVQAPALFHNVLKDPIGKEQGQLTHYIPSTQAQKTVTTPVVTSHSARLSHAAHSVRSKSVAQEKASAPAALTQGAFTQGVPTSHAVPRPPMHVTAQRPQPPAVGYSVVNSGTNFYGQVPLASGVSQQQNVQATTLPQGHTQVPSSAASVYGHVQNTAGSSQMPSLQIAASQTQGGVYIQGGGNQVFQMNIADTNQLKGAFQLQSALYQGAIPTTFLAANSAGKPAVPNAPGGVAQAVYPTNPYMLGILMPTAMSQSVTTASVTSTVTTATSPSVTAVAAPVPSVASYSYNNQNAAIAAAFESFVPIAPAASPRFSQTLAHLASAYTPFMPRGVVQGNTPVQFAQRMVPMSNMPTQACGNGQMGAPVLNLTDYTLKYPINAVKPSTYPTQVSTAATGASVNTLQQAAVVTAMPYVAFGQINSPRFPFAAVNFATPGAGTNSSNTAPSTPALGSAITPATSSHYAAGGNVDSQAGNAVLGYVTMPFNTNTGGASHVASNPFTGSAFSAPSSNTNVSFSSQGGHTPGPQHVTWCSPGAANQRGCHTSENNSPGCCVSTASSASIPLPSSRSSCAEVSAPSGIVSTTASTNCYQPGQSPRYSGGPSPLNSPTTFPQSNIPLSACQGSAMSETPVSSKNSMEDMPSQSQTYNTSDCCKKRHSPSGLSSALSKRTYDDGSDSKKRTKYDESAYYEANPLLGLKRSCEAIEVAYGEAEREDGEEGVEDSERPAKNEEASPGSSGKPGEGYLNSNNYGDHNNCNEDNCDSGEIKTPNEEQSSSAYVEPISERRQSHSVYNGDVTANRDKDQLARVVVNQDSYPPVKTNPMLPIPVERPDCHGGPPVPNTRPHFDIGDIVWAQARGLPSWPGKVVDESEVGKGRPDDGKRWVMWFGDHTFSQVEVDRLKTLSDGLRTLDDKARKKKYRAKKARISLEQAISEALEALEMRERLRARQAARSKAKKKRVR